MMRHFGIRPYACSECPRTFTESRDLDKHKANAHSTERPHSCPHCEWSFKDISALYGHARRKHNVVLSVKRRRGFSTTVSMDDKKLARALLDECCGKQTEDVLRCALCGAIFNRRGNLYVHGRRFHGRDFKRLLHEEMRRTHLRFPSAHDEPDNNVASPQTEKPNEEQEGVVEGCKIIGEISHEELVECVGQELVLKGAQQPECPICREVCADKISAIRHGKECHDIDFLALLDDWTLNAGENPK